MALDTNQKQKVREHFDGIGGTPDCSVCGRNSWRAEGVVVAPELRDDHKLEMTGSATPMLQLACDHCGHVLLFVATRMGLT